MMSKSYAKRYFDYLFPFIVILVASFLVIVYDLAFWFFLPLPIAIYFWRKYQFSFIIAGSACFYIASYFVGNAIADMTNIAFHLLIIGVVLGSVALAEKVNMLIKRGRFEKSRVMAFLAGVKSDYLAYIIIAVLVVVIDVSLGAFTNTPVGDDAYLHVGKALFIKNNFPNTNWYPNWFLGIDMFETYPPAYYLLVVFANLITGISAAGVIVVFFFIAMFLLGVGVYKVSRAMDLPRYLSLGFSAAWLALPIAWGETVIGGAYLRSFAIPFFILSLLMAYHHVKSVNRGKSNNRAFISLIFLLSFTAVLHEMIGVFAVVSIFLIYLLAVKGLKLKLKNILMVFIPVIGLISWWYVPLINYMLNFKSSLVNDLGLSNLERLNVSLSPLILPIALFVGGFFIINILRNREEFSAVPYEKKAISAVFLLLTLYFFIFACFPMPENLYLMAAYDYEMWFGIFLMLLLISLAGILFSNFSGKLHFKEFSKTLSIILIIIVALAFVLTLPNIHLVDANPDNPDSWFAGISQSLNAAANLTPDNYRLTAITRRYYAISQYSTPSLDLAGGRQSGTYHGYYDTIFRERVLFRYNEDQSLYIEERLPQHSDVPYSAANYLSSLYWMDWYGVNGIITAPWEQTLETFTGYYERPQYFTQLYLPGGSTYIGSNQSSPILTATNAPVVGFIGNDTAYKMLLLTLGELNLNSQIIIPVKLDTQTLEQELPLVDSVLIDSGQYATYQATLQNYVNAGGDLAVMDYNCNNATQTQAKLVESNVVFSTYAKPIKNAGDYTQIIAQTNEGAIITQSTVGLGTVTNSAVSLQELYQDASPQASLILCNILLPDLTLRNVAPQLRNANVNLEALDYVDTNLNRADELTISGDLAPNGEVQLQIPLDQTINITADGFIQFELLNDSQQKLMHLNLASSQTDKYLTYNISDTTWQGWKSFSLPLASFTGSQDTSALKDFDTVVLTIENQNSQTATLSFNQTIRSLSYHEVQSTSTYTPIKYSWAQPNLLQATMQNTEYSHLLLKESYDSNWQITTDLQSGNITYLYAGPGVMLVFISPDANSITFFKPLSQVQNISIAISSLTLLSLAVLLTLRRLHILGCSRPKPEKLKTKKA